MAVAVESEWEFVGSLSLGKTFKARYAMSRNPERIQVSCIQKRRSTSFSQMPGCNQAPLFQKKKTSGDDQAIISAHVAEGRPGETSTKNLAFFPRRLLLSWAATPLAHLIRPLSLDK
jgi:hypothetical protein